MELLLSLRYKVEMARSQDQKTIFSFWEPQGVMTPYLQLCKKTWERHLSQYNIVFLNYSNLSKYLPANILDMSVLKGLTLMMQKDAIMIGVLKVHGGIFMDADTIIIKDILPIVSKLKDTEMVMFNTHLAFVAARPGSYVLDLWLKKIQCRIKYLGDNNIGGSDLKWDYLGNSVLADVMDEMIYGAGYIGKLQKYILDKGILAIQPQIKNMATNTSKSKKLLYKLCNFLRRKKREVLFDAMFRGRLTMLDRLKYGYIQEANYFKTRMMTPEQKYQNFWFENDKPIQTVFLNNPSIIGLHNSWTPKWYKELAKQDVLDNDCLLSRTLKDLLRN